MALNMKCKITFILFVACVCIFVLALMYYPKQTVGACLLATVIQAINDCRKWKNGRGK